MTADFTSSIQLSPTSRNADGIHAFSPSNCFLFFFLSLMTDCHATRHTKACSKFPDSYSGGQLTCSVQDEDARTLDVEPSFRASKRRSESGTHSNTKIAPAQLQVPPQSSEPLRSSSCVGNEWKARHRAADLSAGPNRWTVGGTG